MDRLSPVHARVVPALRGVRWLAEGWELFKVSPLLWFVLVLAYWMVMSALGLVPFVGVAAATVLIPAFSVGFMAASRDCERRQPPVPPRLFEGFRANLRTQLALGVVYLSCLAVLLAASALSDRGALAHSLIVGQLPSDETLQSDAFSRALLTVAALYVPVMMMFWFAPVLAAWHGLHAGKALFFSFFASLINWRAFLVYAGTVGLTMVAIPIALFVALSLLVGALPGVLMGLLFLTFVILLPTLLASFYASYRDIFASSADA